MLEKDGSVSIQHRNILSLAMEMCKVQNKLAPMITASVFCAKPENHYNRRQCNDFRISFAKNGTGSISHSKPWH